MQMPNSVRDSFLPLVWASCVPAGHGRLAGQQDVNFYNGDDNFDASGCLRLPLAPLPCSISRCCRAVVVAVINGILTV
jgi:hypothetical protein